MRKPVILLLLLLFVIGCEATKTSEEIRKQEILDFLAKENVTDPCVIDWFIGLTADTEYPIYYKLDDEKLNQATIQQINRQNQTPSPPDWLKTNNFKLLEPDAYGMGVHINRFAQPVILKPDFGGVYGEHLEIKTDGYGMGVHSDQYGRPVREYPWP